MDDEHERHSYHSEILLRHLIYPCYSWRGTEIALLDIHRVVGIIKWNGGWGGEEPREETGGEKRVMFEEVAKICM